ncbi:MAG TPA: SDR family NAD(P)-dependent oxidoreductase, partial [Acidimicrobiales bacterium]|nr:SDR family NAD(P)-dependent oxidoreductase [Acidimicrobiales bacterium]
AIVAWVESHLGVGTTPSAEPAHAAPEEAAPADAAPVEDDPSAPQSDIPDSAVRAVFRAVPAPLVGAQRDIRVPAGGDITVVNDGRGVAPLVASLLESHGVGARVVEPDGIPDVSGGIVHIGLLHPGPHGVVDLFEQVHAAAVAGASTLVAVTGLGGTHGRCTSGGAASHLGVTPAPAPVGETENGTQGTDETDRTEDGTKRENPERARRIGQTGAGVAGLWRALARERPDAHVRAVDLDPLDDPVVLAGQIVAEVLAAGGPVAVGYRDGERYTVVAAEEVLANGPGSSPDQASRIDRPRRARGIDLGPDSVVLLTGGARGITARLAVSLATTYGCSLELVGRSPVPDGPEDPELASATGAAELRQRLIARGERTPAAIEASVARLLAAREIRSTLSALDDAGVKVAYHAVDVRDADAVRGVVDSVYDRHGRLDGVVHGAGVIEDRLLADKTSESFRRVFDTKVHAAHTLVGAVREPHPFVVLFTSVSGAFGNKGQVDYAAANDALSALAWSLTAQEFGPVVAVDWGPWAGSGMVTPQLDREYARRRVGLVHPEDGIARLLDELRACLPQPEIVLARARVSTFEAPAVAMEQP